MSGIVIAVLVSLLTLLTVLVVTPARFVRRFPEDDLLRLLRAVGGDRAAAARLAELERTAAHGIDDATAIRRAVDRIARGRR